MIVVSEHEQGTAEWLQDRCGIPTASEMSNIVTSTGKVSTSRKAYMRRLAGERLINMPEEQYKSFDMQRGNDLEEEARLYYQMIHGPADVKRVGFHKRIVEECGWGASPDGLVGEDGCLEIKCPKLHTHVDYLLQQRVPTDYVIQVQGILNVTGRQWCDFISYYPNPDMPMLCIRVHRDEFIQERLNHELIQFCKELDEMYERLLKLC